jgi:hypothetical protein
MIVRAGAALRLRLGRVAAGTRGLAAGLGAVS